jgi:hypothetical protein
MSQRIQSGKPAKQDVATLMEMHNYSHEDARRIASGKGTIEEYGAISRRAGAFTTNQPQVSAEMARAEHTRFFRTAFAFSTYGMMSAREFWRSAKTFAEIGVKTKWGTKDAQGRKDMAGAVQKMAKKVAGSTMAGSMTSLALAFLTGGVTGLNVALEEFKDSPWRFLRDSYIYYTVSGPFGAILRQTQQHSGNLGETVFKATFPGSLLTELHDMGRGQGRYRDLRGMEKAFALVERYAPINRVYAAAVTGFGFGNDQQDTTTAIRAYWRWKMDKDPSSIKFTETEPDMLRADFRRAMKKADLAMRRGEDPTEFIEQALKIDGKEPKNVAQSLRQRKLLDKIGHGKGLTDDQKDELRATLKKRIGEKAYSLIEAHDALLENYADSVVPSRRGRARSRPRRPTRRAQRAPL